MSEYDWIGPKEVAALCGIDITTLLLWHKEGCGPPHYVSAKQPRVRTYRRYRKDDVTNWLERQRRRG